MTSVTQNTDASTLTIRDRANAFSPQKVGAMVRKVKDSFERRDIFEAAKGVASTGSSSYAKGRLAIMKNEVAVARFLLARNIEPANFFERSLQSGDMFNAKALIKFVEIATWSCGNKSKIQKVTKAFLACLVVMTEKGHEIVTNKVNRAFLSNTDFSAIISDVETVEQLHKERHIVMTGGAPTQSSQVRCVLESIGAADIVTTDRARDSIALHRNDELLELFKVDYMK